MWTVMHNLNSTLIAMKLYIYFFEICIIFVLNKKTGVWTALSSLRDLTHQPESPTKWIDTSHCLKPKNTYWYFKLHIWTIYSLRSTKSMHFQPSTCPTDPPQGFVHWCSTQSLTIFSNSHSGNASSVWLTHLGSFVKHPPVVFSRSKSLKIQRKKTMISRKWLLVQIVGCHFL